MKRLVVLLHAQGDSSWAHRASGRLGREGHQTICVVPTAASIAQIDTWSVRDSDVMVAVLSRALLADASVLLVIEVMIRHWRGQCLTLVMEQALQRDIPRGLGHVHALVKPGEKIAALVAELAPPSAPAPRPRYGIAAVTTLVLLAWSIVALLVVVSVHELATRLNRDDPPAAHEAPSALVRDEHHAHPPDVPPIVVPPLVDSEAPLASSPPVASSPAHLEIWELPMGNAGSLRFRHLDGGSFTMGDPRSTSGVSRPHAVRVDGFWMGEAEVTQAQWTAVMGSNPSELGGGIGEELPVQNVTWPQVISFLNHLSQAWDYAPCYSQRNDQWHWDRSCDGFRLPTEAEWEYAARSGTTTDYPHGNNMRALCRYANTSDAAARRVHATWPSIGCEDGFVHLAPVEQLAPNPWHLYDMQGNVQEWVWDWFAPYPAPGAAAAVDTGGPEHGRHRVVRGGNYRLKADGARSGSRWRQSPRHRNGRTGFRIARSETIARRDPAAP